MGGNIGLLTHQSVSTSEMEPEPGSAESGAAAEPGAHRARWKLDAESESIRFVRLAIAIGIRPLHRPRVLARHRKGRVRRRVPDRPDARLLLAR